MNKNMKKRILIASLSVLLIVAVLVFVIAVITKSHNRNGYYKNIKWGITSEEVKKEFKKIGVADSSKEASDKTSPYFIQTKDGSMSIQWPCYDKRDGVNALVFCNFDKNGFSSVQVLLTIADDSPFTEKELIKAYVKQFNSWFGEYEDSNDATEYVWHTDEGEIKVAYPLGIMLTLEYSK